MKDLKRIVHNFLKIHCDFRKPLLLALSGGSDSIALFHCLYEISQNKTLTFHIAHVDHGWREESRREAEQLKALAEEKNIPFHIKTLNPALLTGNLEAECRKERLSFYATLCAQYSYQAVLLGHHANDVAETVFKSLMEGSSFPFIQKIGQNACIEGVPIWRPLLNVAKQEIVSWLSRRNFSWFSDPTNSDPKFLRGKLRIEMIPYISSKFGKNIHSSLLNLAEESLEISNYLDRKIDFLIKGIQRGSFGFYLDFTGVALEPLELKFLVRKICQKEKMTLSREIIDQIIHAVCQNLSNCLFQMGNLKIWVDRQILFWVNQALECAKQPLAIADNVSFGPWKIGIRKADTPSAYATSWKEGWSGLCEVVLPEGDYYLCKPDPKADYYGKFLHKWWTEHKIPVFLRNRFPVIRDQNHVYHEFLTGKNRTCFNGKTGVIHLTLKI